MARSASKRDHSYFDRCPVIFSLNVLGKKWLIPVMCELNHNSVMRFGDLLKSIEGITSVTLTQALKDLQGLGIVNRIQYNEIPLRVEYSLTQMGQDLLPSIYELARWSVCMKPTRGEQTCGKGSCPAHTMHLLNIKREEIGTAYQQWDDAFLQAMEELEQRSALKALDPLDKIRFVMEYTITKAVECGEEQSRLQTIYYIIGDERSQDLVEATRPAYTVLRQLLAEGRDQDIIIDEMDDDQIIASFMAFRHGLVASWELERGAYDVIARNQPAIRAFVNGFRKTKQQNR